MIEPVIKLRKKGFNKKKIILGSIIGVLVGTLLSVSYAVFTYTRTGTLNSKLIVGDIYMRYKGNNELNFQNALPSSTYTPGKYFEFEIIGKNTTTDKDIVYDIVLNHGVDNPQNRSERIQDKFLKFRLVRVSNYGEQNESEFEVITPRTYNNISNTRIFISTIPHSISGLPIQEVREVYRLYTWIDNSVIIGNAANADYTQSEWENLYASISVTVTGDFSNKELTPIPNNAVTTITNKLGTDGLIGVNTSGGLYDSNDQTQEIREYRFSGGENDVKNYIWFNNENWRIVGVFDEKIKIVKDTPIENAPTTYTKVATSYDPSTETFNIQNGIETWSDVQVSKIYFDNPTSGTTSNDWVHSGLQYYLNDVTDRTNDGEKSFYDKLDNRYKGFISVDSYDLKNVDHNVTPSEAYNQERAREIQCDSSMVGGSNGNNCNVYYGHAPYWQGKISLLYSSDFGYASNPAIWNGTNTTMNTYSLSSSDNWLLKTDDTGWYWLLTSSSAAPVSTYNWRYDGVHYSKDVNTVSGVRPTLYLNSDTQFVGNGDGSKLNPYRLISE